MSCNTMVIDEKLGQIEQRKRMQERLDRIRDAEQLTRINAEIDALEEEIAGIRKKDEEFHKLFGEGHSQHVHKHDHKPNIQ